MSEESYIRTGLANLMKGMEGVGGKLYLTSTELIHKSHAINVQRGTVTLDLADIETVERVRNKLLGVPLLKNGLKITTNDGEELRYVVNKASQRGEDIEQAINKEKPNVM
ncbi:GRAM domain-containing protein [Priestia flexa]|jgi:GRAM domain|uniref:GRAM domain-containing protein n=1 Tax=Priestia flexa TaxID=86664 RepID=A0A8I1SNF4_9BACI|nr:GRAM domain-containing protein [Priestia flexa]MBN8251376.1 hypothetical protein [Priestia flexa]MBN8434361.1 hypothetical protein [Priestia flexa]MCA0966855.1 GRAM domain-containing protein [Priestia flexa]RIV09474.1 hypothetical protein D1859_11915 [Priestia flexa]UIR31726.1 GRAM domain-containing protein [Priestia flexa]